MNQKHKMPIDIGSVGTLASPFELDIDIDVISIEEVIWRLLTNNQDIASLADKRVYPNVITAKVEVPAITYQVIATVRGHTMSGPDGLTMKRVQINCWATHYAIVNRLARFVRVLLDGFKGTVGGRVISCVLLDNEGDMPEMMAESSLNRYGRYLDFLVWYQESIT